MLLDKTEEQKAILKLFKWFWVSYWWSQEKLIKPTADESLKNRCKVKIHKALRVVKYTCVILTL